MSVHQDLHPHRLVKDLGAHLKKIEELDKEVVVKLTYVVTNVISCKIVEKVLTIS